MHRLGAKMCKELIFERKRSFAGEISVQPKEKPLEMCPRKEIQVQHVEL